MSTNYSPTIVTGGEVFVGDARESSTATAGSRLYDQAGVNSTAVKLLIHGNEGSGQSFADSSLSNHTITVNGSTTHSTTKSKFSGGSIKFDGTGDYLRTSSEDFLDGNWTVDCWFYYDASFPGTIEGLIALDYDGASGSSNNALNFGVTSGAMALLVSSNVSSGWNIVNTTGGTVTANAWNHGAVVFDGSTYKAYLNGSQVISVTSSTAVASQSSSQIIVGTTADGSSGQSWNGYIDEVRVTQAALWTNTFTPPARRDTLVISDGMMYNGSCIDLDGTDDYIDLGSIAFGTKDINIALWFTIDAFDDDYACIFCNRTSTTGNVGFEIRQRTSGTKIELQFDWGSGSNSVETGALSTGTWHHIVATLDRSGYLRGYLNGVEFGSPLDISSQSATSITSDQSAKIGKDAYASYWNGQVGDLKIYENTVLSASQVKEIYNNSKVIIPSNVSQTNLMGWWPLAEGAGTLCYDGSGNGQTGTITNGEDDEWLTGQTGAPQLVEGYNRPMLFPGATSDYVAVGNSSSFCFGTGNFSFGAWVNTSDSAFQMVFDAIDPTYKGWQFAISNLTPKMRLWVSTGSANVNLDASMNVCDGKWHHVGFTVGVASPQDVTIYVDGSSVASYNGWSNLNMVGGTYASWIGGQSSGPNYPFKGLINEVVLYDTLLSSSEMAALAATGPPRNINLLTGDNASFDGGVGSWTANGGSIAASAGELVITGDGSAAGVNVLINLGGFVVGRSYIFSGYIKQGSSTNTDGHIQVYDTSGSGVDASTAFSTTGGLTDIFQKYSVEFVATATTLRLYLYKSGTDSATYIADNLTVYAAGGDPLPPDPMSLSNSSDVVAYWRNDGNTTWKNRGPKTIKNFTGVATDPINDSSSVGSWTNNGTSLTSVTGGRKATDGNQPREPRYRFLFDSAINCTVNSIISVTSGKSYKVSAWFKGGTSTTARLIVTGGYYDSGNFTASSTVWTNKTDIFTATSTGNVTVELHNRAAGTMYFDDVTFVESGPAFDGTVDGSPSSVLFKQGINGSASTSTGRDGQGFPLKYKDVGAIGFNGSDTKVTFSDVDLDLSAGATVSFWCNHSENTNGAVVGSDDNAYHSYIQPHENGNIYFESSDDSNTAQGEMSFTDGFHNYVLVVQDYTATFYEDGVDITTDSSLSTANVSFNYIGTTGNKWFKGSVANLLIYNRALDYDEIKQNYNAQKSRFE